MKFSFEVFSKLELEYTKETENVRHVGTKFFLECSKNLDRSKYLDKRDLPTKEGCIAITNVLIQGLVGNLHFSNQKGYRESAEHLRYIIGELEKLSFEVTKVEESTFH